MSKLHDKIGQFATIPFSVISRIPDIGPESFAMFCYFRRMTNSQSEVAFPSYETIHKDTGLTKRRIARAIRILIDAGLCERKRRFGKSTIYALIISNPVDTIISNPVDTIISNPVDTIISNPVDTLNRLNEIDRIEIDRKKESPDGETVTVEESHRKRTDRDIAVDDLESKFSALSRLQKPDRKKKKSSGPTLWWSPLQAMWELCDKDTGQAWQLIEAAYKKLIEAQMTVSSPKSLLNTAIALHANGGGRKGITIRC